MAIFKNTPVRRVLKWGAVLLLGIAAVAGIVLGPMLLDYYRFADHVETTSRESIAAAGAWPRVSDACMPCHGFGGNPASQVYARLAGQPKAYLVQQLTAFASGERANPTMGPLAADLGAEEIERLATFFAAQPVLANAPFAADPVRVQNGELLAKAGNCTACHGAALQGQDARPRLAGQGSVYLARQLRGFKSGDRRDPEGAMATVTVALSDDDIENLAQYLATLTTTAGH